MAVRPAIAEPEQPGGSATAARGFSAKAGSGCRRLEGYSVDPAATHGFAAGEQPGTAAKRGCAAGGFHGAAFAATEHHGRTRRCEEGIYAAVHADCEDRLAAKCLDVGRHVLRSKSACALRTVRSDPQAARPAVQICRSRFSWRSAAERACYSFGPGELKIGSGKSSRTKSPGTK